MLLYSINTRKSWVSSKIRLTSKVCLHYHGSFGKTSRELPDGSEFAVVRKCNKKSAKVYQDTYGVFAKKEIDSNVCMVPVVGIYMLELEYKSLKKPYAEYAIKLSCPEDKPTIIVVPELNRDAPIWAFTNDAKRKGQRKNRNNCYFETLMIEELPVGFIKSRRKLKKGDQIFTDYGKAYWNKYGYKLVKNGY